MHIVTFYSFKGGVGRTMALVNVAAELAGRGRKVLVVDFDLEAPGLQTYAPFSGAQTNRGIVEYVIDFIASAEAPDVSQYLVKKEIKGQPIWLMPSGIQDGSYANRLNSIDWLSLYSNFNGYLMFEDLKQQWKAVGNFDYVLIDSRTGHTDVAGICTRQLPDAVVLLFIPNDQNLAGLKDIVRDIRHENESVRKRSIALHFCPSNVPDLDDEELILQRRLQKAMHLFGYEKPATVLTHYNSLALLDQEIFTSRRPTTRLAREYQALVDAIVSSNLEDRSGALSRLEQIRQLLRSDRASVDLQHIERSIDKIYQFHVDDGEVAWSLSLVYELLGDTDAQLDTLTKAIDKHHNEIRARSKRAQLHWHEGHKDLAKEDLKFVVMAEGAPIADVVSGIQRLRVIDNDWLKTVRESAGIRKLGGADINRVTNALTVNTEGAVLAAELLQDQIDPVGRNNLSIAQIGAGQFRLASLSLGDRDKVLKNAQVEHVFNLACAEWGETRSPPVDLFARVAELMRLEPHRSRGDSNFSQCLAMTFHVIGDMAKARAFLREAESALDAMPPTIIFSGWRFLNVRKAQFRSDLVEMRTQMRTRKQLEPRFLNQSTL